MQGIKHRDTEIVGHEDGIPIVICDTHPYNRKLYVVSPGEAQWRFYCQYCRRYHYHGNVPGHRVAHCGKDTPFSKTGYILKLRVK